MDHILMKEDRVGDPCLESNSDLKATKDSSEDDNIIAHAISKKRFQVREQCSQDENFCPENLVFEKEIPLSINGHSSICSEVNCSNSSLIPNINKQCFNENNNHVLDKGNLRYPDEKSCCYYMKFPIKVNNNIYPDKSSNVKKDGMDDYFQQYSSTSSASNNISCDAEQMSPRSATRHSTRLTDQQQFTTNGDCRSPSYTDQINALNGEEEDEDNGCIYTYKGDNYEANLSHLLETCFSCGLPTSESSASQHGAVSIQRILNGSLHPNPQSNLYSPDMDFLEMDFDPGSAGDGGDSDCEDNSILNVDPKVDKENSLENFALLDSKIEKKSNYIPNEMKSLMCRRCEMCIYNEQKVNNTASSFTQKLPVESSMHKNDVASKVEDKLNRSSSNNSINYSSNKSVNLDLDSQPDLLNVNGLKEVTNNQVENNLNADDGVLNEEFSDGDDADDEGGDDSISEHPPSDVRGASLNSVYLPSSSDFPVNNGLSTSNDFSSKALSGVGKTNKQLRFSLETVYSKLPNRTTGNDKFHSNIENGENLTEFSDSKRNCYYGTDLPDKINSENNNLGSISAPEVSPSKEYSPLQKFSRSISFHNQLSSPKYENVCFSLPYKDNFSSNVNKCQTSGNSNEGCSCKHGNSYHKNFQNSEVANLEACVDRLNQREKSVFNISSNSNSPQHLRSPLRGLNQHGNKGLSSASSSNGITAIGHSSPETSNILNSAYYNGTDRNFIMGNSEENCDLNDNAGHLLLPQKVLHHKNDDPTIDPNTACEGDLEGDHGDEHLKSSTVEKVMIWTERQATVRQVSQVGTSACGPTAVINVLLALDHQRPISTVTSIIRTRLRAENGSLVEYLLSRSNAGTTHEDLLCGVQSISEGAITGRFFHMFPKRAFQLSRWLSHWIKKGGAPVATLNLQVAVSPNQTIPDAWHHQMVFGVGEQGIYLTNPLECVSDSLLSDQLCSDSVLLVRRADIESRWDQNDKLISLSLQEDPKWNDMNVLGQVVCVLKEQAAPEMLQGRRHLTYHVAIPAAYQSGVTIFIRTDNPAKAELFDETELPLLDE